MIPNLNDVIVTNYRTGPFVVTGIFGPCTCPRFIDVVNMENPPRSPIHFHYHLADMDGEEGYGVNGFDFENQSVWRPEHSIHVLERCVKKNGQLKLF